MRNFLRRNGIALSLLLCAAAFLTYGLSRGEIGIVFTRAIRLCLECIGIG